MKHTAYIALGSNMGDRARTLLLAAKQLDAIPGVAVRRVSQFFRTAPVGLPGTDTDDQNEYLNAAAEVETSLSPQKLLERLHEVERRLGRRRENEQRWGPRTCDLDILTYGEVIMTTPELTIPHPRMHERRFVLEPLASIAPDLLHPLLCKTVAALLAELPDAPADPAEEA